MRVLVRGSGFTSPFRRELDEIRCGKPADIGGVPSCRWSPSNPDLEALARRSGGGPAAATLNDLAAIIERQAPGSIDELRILGHSSDHFFALGGKVVTDDKEVLVRFAENASMGLSATFLSMRPRFQRLRDRFSAKGRITLAGCGSGGTDAALLELVSSAFLVCVSGFARPIQYGLNSQFPLNVKNRIGPGWVITERGRVSYSAATLAIEERLNASYVDIFAFPTDAWTLQSDAESCAGQVLLDAAARSGKATTMIDAMGAATAVGWAILKEFFTGKTASFAGVRGDESLRGLRLDVKDGRWFLVVGVPYARATNASTIEQRTKEMAELLEMRAAGRPGTVLMK